jgi:integrase
VPWWQQVQSIENSVMRYYRVFLLLTGLRKRDARTVRWEDLDLSKGTMHRPVPKGGTEKAFTEDRGRIAVGLESELTPDGPRANHGDAEHHATPVASVPAAWRGTRPAAPMPISHRLRRYHSSALRTASLLPAASRAAS